MTQIVEYMGFKWHIDDGYPASKEPVREYESTVIELCDWLGDKDKVFVDVGACVGKYSIPMSKRYGKVIAIEPNPKNLELLRKNIEINDCPNIEILEIAVSDYVGLTKLSLEGSQSKIDSFGKDNSVTVKVDILDNVVEKADVIKIDVEGAELSVIRGAMKLIENFKPIFIVEHTEYWSSDQPKMHKEILKLLHSRGYKAFNYNFTHWVYVPKVKYGKLSDLIKGMLMSHHVFYEVIVRNLKEGRAWYHGLPYSWWHGMSILEFFIHLTHHAPYEDEWEKVYKNTIERYLK